MKKQFFLSLILMFVITACGVHNKSSYMESFEEFISKVEAKEEFEIEELEEMEEKFVMYTETYYKEYKDQLTSADLRKMGELKARYIKAVAKSKVNGMGKALKGLGDEMEGFLDGLGK